VSESTGTGRRLQRGAIYALGQVIAVGVVMGTAAGDAYASCTASGTTISCTGAANPLSPGFSSSTNNLTVNVASGSSLGVLLGVGGTALSLTGNNVTLNNAGTVDPSLLGALSILSSGTVIGNSSASNVNITNSGTMNGTMGAVTLNVASLTGLALAVQNGAGGVTNITNTGTIGSASIAGVSIAPGDRT
jgi:fibronectin-binding autotransporter adhesin